MAEAARIVGIVVPMLSVACAGPILILSMEGLSSTETYNTWHVCPPMQGLKSLHADLKSESCYQGQSIGERR